LFFRKSTHLALLSDDARPGFGVACRERLSTALKSLKPDSAMRRLPMTAPVRTFEGAVVFVRLRSVVSTSREQRRNILEALTENPAKLPAALAARLTRLGSYEGCGGEVLTN
jgi:hypothetical protein